MIATAVAADYTVWGLAGGNGFIPSFQNIVTSEWTWRQHAKIELLTSFVYRGDQLPGFPFAHTLAD